MPSRPRAWPWPFASELAHPAPLDSHQHIRRPTPQRRQGRIWHGPAHPRSGIAGRRLVHARCRTAVGPRVGLRGSFASSHCLPLAERTMDNPLRGRAAPAGRHPSAPSDSCPLPTAFRGGAASAFGERYGCRPRRLRSAQSSDPTGTAWLSILATKRPDGPPRIDEGPRRDVEAPSLCRPGQGRFPRSPDDRSGPDKRTD